MSRTRMLTDAQWARLEPLLPPLRGHWGRPFKDHRLVVEGIIYRNRTGVAWRDLPGEFGPWKTVWKRHRKFSQDGTWDRIHAHLVAEADAADELDWTVSVDSTVNRAHQHATNAPRAESPTGGQGRITRSRPVCALSPATTQSAALVADCRPRSISSSMAAAGPWSSR